LIFGVCTGTGIGRVELGGAGNGGGSGMRTGSVLDGAGAGRGGVA
jgi:hypothetical protein